MSDNFKNKLQEIAQKKRWGLPIYKTYRVDGQDHKPIFRSKAMLNGIVVSQVGSSKKKAEKKAAKALYSIFSDYYDEEIRCNEVKDNEVKDNEVKDNEVKDNEFKVSTDILASDSRISDTFVLDIQDPLQIYHVIMIDGENLPNIVSEIAPTEGLQIIIYFSKHHHNANTKYNPHIIKRISPCTRSDGCDIFIAMDIMTLPEEFPNVKKITVFSRDKFAAAVADNASAFWRDIQVEHKVDH